MKIKLPYLKDYIEINVPQDNVISVLEPNVIPETSESDSLLRNSLDKTFYDFLNLPGKLLVIVNDGTRPTPTSLVLNVISDLLQKSDVRFIIATGGHRKPSEDEYEFIFGNNLPRFRDKILFHDCKDMNNMSYYGKTSYGTELYLNKEISCADKILVIGSVEPHYFAGYTGGRKAFLPGTAAHISIEQNHKLALSDNACTLSLENNPVHRDMMEAVSFLKLPIYSIQIVLDREQAVSAVCCGDLADSFRRATFYADKIFTVPVKEKADIVVTCARYPMDIDLYQSQKAMDNAALALKDGGTMILVSSCRDGIGNDTFYKILSGCETPDAVMKKIQGTYKLGYHKAAKMCSIFRRANVQAYTNLDKTILSSIFITPVDNLQTAVDNALKKHGKNSKILFMPDGSVTVPKVITRS